MSAVRSGPSETILPGPHPVAAEPVQIGSNGNSRHQQASYEDGMNAPKEGCEICAISAKADRRGDALAVIACRSGPEFLKRCTICGAHWLETLRFEQWLDADEAAELFGGSLLKALRAPGL